MDSQKHRQVEYHDREHYGSGAPRHADNGNPLIAWLNSYRIRKMLDMIGTPLSGKTVLCVCGGDGEEADFLQKLGARVTTTDLSAQATRAAQLRNPALHCIEMDAESLGFADCSFDWTIVRDGLHHLARPIKGLYELERMSREGFAILEGQDSIPVRLLAKIGLAETWDPAGGYVYRFSRREIQKVFAAVQTVASYSIHTVWLPFGNDVLRFFPSFRQFVFPIINHPSVLRTLSSKPGRQLLKCGFGFLNFLVGHWGNSLIVVARKRSISRLAEGIAVRVC